MTTDIKDAAEAYAKSLPEYDYDENVVAFIAGYTHALKHAPEVVELVKALECVEGHDYGKADLFDTMKNTVMAALSAYRAKVGERGV